MEHSKLKNEPENPKDDSAVNNTFGTVAKAPDLQAEGSIAQKGKGSSTARSKKIQNTEPHQKENDRTTTFVDDQDDLNGFDGEDGQSTNRIGGGLSVASSQMMLPFAARSARRNHNQGQVPEESHGNLKSFRSRRNSDSWSEGELTKMNVEPDQTR